MFLPEAQSSGASQHREIALRTVNRRDTRDVEQQPCLTAMPSSDYTSAIGGGLKLKGSKDAGVKKSTKKKKKPASESTSAGTTDLTAAQRALADEETGEGDHTGVEETQEVKDYGKTEAQRRHEERRRKRVGYGALETGYQWGRMFC